MLASILPFVLLLSQQTELQPEQLTEAPRPAVTRAHTGVDSGEAELVCREWQRTGTRFRGRVCRSRDEWRRRAEQARESVQELHQGSRHAFVSEGGG